MAELELKRRRIQKKSKRTKQTRKKQGGSRGQSQVASGRRADQGLRKAKKILLQKKSLKEVVLSLVKIESGRI